MTIKELLKKIEEDEKELQIELKETTSRLKENEGKFRKAGIAITMMGEELMTATKRMVAEHMKQKEG